MEDESDTDNEVISKNLDTKKLRQYMFIKCFCVVNMMIITMIIIMMIMKMMMIIIIYLGG